jgi:hypothetical protein
MPGDMDFRRNGPRLCEKAKTLNRDRTSYSFEIVFGAHIEIELKNIILVALRVFEFSHSLGQLQTLRLAFDHLVCTSERGLTLAIRLSADPQ